jgi:hypothetical protein
VSQNSVAVSVDELLAADSGLVEFARKCPSNFACMRMHLWTCLSVRNEERHSVVAGGCITSGHSMEIAVDGLKNAAMSR